MKLLGKQIVNYTSKKTGQPVEGVSLHCSGVRSDVEGIAVETIFVSKRSEKMYEQVMAIPLNSDIQCTYNRWGSVDSVQACK